VVEPMIPTDFMALIEFIRNTLINVWNALDGVVIVDDTTYRFTFLTAGISIVFLNIVMRLINRIRRGNE
jgi:hypothetical protein